MKNNVWVLLFLAALPVILISRYVYKKDKNKEPAKLLIKLFFMGIASCFMVFLISDIMQEAIPLFGAETESLSFFELLIYVFVGIALVEEFCKWFMLYTGAYKNKEYEEVYDGLVYAVFVSLGFAFFENILYVLGNDSIATGIFRGVLAVPGHACDAVFMGHFLSMAKMASIRNDKANEKKYLWYSVLVPTALHGIYDFCLFSNIGSLVIGFFVFVIALFIISVKRIKLESYENKRFLMNNKFCPKCGAKVVGPFCGNCGARQD